MSDSTSLEKLMNAHLASIANQLADLRTQQGLGFQRIQAAMDRRDELTDRELRDLNERVDNVEQTMNRWGGAFALALVAVGMGVPFLIWALNLVTK